MKPYVMLSVLALVAFGSSTLPATETVAKLAAQAAREYDILAPSLRTAAMELLKEVTAHQKKNPRKPSVSRYYEHKKYKTFVDLEFDEEMSRHKYVAIPTEKRYVISATARTFRYELKGLDRISRTGLRDAPFAGAVLVEITITDRVATAERSEPFPAPKGYRPATDKKAFATLAENLGLFEDAFIVERQLYPLPQPAPPHLPADSWPKVVQKTVPELHKRCEKAEPVTKMDTHEVTFRYSLSKKKWEWQWPTKSDEPAGD